MVEDPRVIALKRIRNYIVSLRNYAEVLLTGRADYIYVIVGQAWRVYHSWTAIRNILSIMMSEFEFDLTDEEIFDGLHDAHVARW